MKVKRCKSLSPEPSSSTNTKRARRDEDEEENGRSIKPSLLHLSDDVLLMIIKSLDPFDILNLSKCCHRLDQVTQDRTLWSVMDYRAKSMTVTDLEKYIKFFQPSVKTFAIRGNTEGKRYSEFTKHFLTTLLKTCTQLKELLIEDCYINGTEIQIPHLPSGLEKLSLKGCDLYQMELKQSYFFGVHEHMPHLTSLILSNCEWFAPHSLMVISKLPKLKELRLDSCYSLGECFAYTSLAARYGFKALEILDLRNTVIGDSEIACFNCTETLTHLYLECPTNIRNRQRGSNSDRDGERTPQEQAERPTGRSRILIQVVHENRMVPQVEVVHADNYNWDEMERFLVTDRTVCSLGNYVCERRIVDNARGGIFRIEEESRICNNPNLRILVVRNYRQVTDRSLHHLSVSKSNLEYVDVTGTSVTREGVEMFKTQKPDVEIVSSFDDL
ncbi:uncharacterized protein LOC122512282 [Leptopilina heterotoma]|uniref:uncharacterized protein LOC122512282 n=1 Tax=Leptopilina heterotoma TaxID=63436 RepID=UPI001CA97A09|nr:uncharacterized protein LOC122512282 [Leptopilina heterotoma]